MELFLTIINYCFACQNNYKQGKQISYLTYPNQNQKDLKLINFKRNTKYGRDLRIDIAILKICYEQLKVDLSVSKSKNLSKLLLFNMIKLKFTNNYHCEMAIQRVLKLPIKFVNFCDINSTYRFKKSIYENLALFLLPFMIKEFYLDNPFKVRTAQCSKFPFIYESCKVEAFNAFLLEFLGKHESFLDYQYRNYMKRAYRFYKSGFVFKHNQIKFECRRLIKNKDYLDMCRFFKDLHIIYEKMVDANTSQKKFKAFHYILSNMILKYNSVIFLLFDNRTEIFKKRFISMYKLKMLKSMSMDLSLFCYFTAVFCSYEITIKKYFLIKSFLLFLEIQGFNYPINYQDFSFGDPDNQKIMRNFFLTSFKVKKANLKGKNESRKYFLLSLVD